MGARSPEFRSNPDLGRALLWGLILGAALWAVGFEQKRPARPFSRSTLVGDGTGQLAKIQPQSPPIGWKDIFSRVYVNISRHRIVAIAAAITFYSLLAIFPAIAALVSLYGLFSDPAAISGQLSHVTGLLPAGAVEVIRDQLMRVAAHENGTLGLTFIAGLAISLWSANAAVKALFDALNIVYGEDEKRGFVKLNAISLTFTSGAIVFLLLSLSALIAVPVLLKYIGADNAAALLMQFGRWPVLLVVLTIALALVYRFGPSRDNAQWRWITWGSVVASIAWLAASLIFSWYATNFGTFNETYGSLGAAIGFMTWMWISAIVILIGAELDAQMEHQTTSDTNGAPPRQRGVRGATMSGLSAHDATGVTREAGAPAG
jgi:membrane protein